MNPIQFETKVKMMTIKRCLSLAFKCIYFLKIINKKQDHEFKDYQ
jgi:hypothetical protein